MTFACFGVNDELIFGVAVEKRLNLVYAFKLILHLSIEIDEVTENELLIFVCLLYFFLFDFFADLLVFVEGVHGDVWD